MHCWSGDELQTRKRISTNSSLSPPSGIHQNEQQCAAGERLFPRPAVSFLEMEHNQGNNLGLSYPLILPLGRGGTYPSNQWVHMLGSALPLLFLGMSSEGWEPGVPGVQAVCVHPCWLAVLPSGCAVAVDAAHQLRQVLVKGHQLLHVSHVANKQPMRGRRGCQSVLMGAPPASYPASLRDICLLLYVKSRVSTRHRGKPSSDFFTSSYCRVGAHPDKKSPFPYHSCCSRFSGQTLADVPGHGVAFMAGF